MRSNIPAFLSMFALTLVSCAFAAADPELELMAPRPTDSASVAARQSAAAQRVQQALAAFASKYSSVIRLERVRVPTRDHHLEPAYLFTPVAMDRDRKYPGLVFVRESAHGQFGISYFPLIAEAIRRGYLVICPEIRGSTGYGLAYYQDIDLAGKEIDDVLSAADFLVGRTSEVDPSRLAVMGISHGGMMVLYALERAPQRFRAGVDVVGPANLLAYAARRVSAADKAEFYGQPSLAGADQDPSILTEKAPLAHVALIRAPLLVMATTNDTNTPLRMHAAPLIAALNAAAVPHEYILYQDAPGGHMFFTGNSDVARAAVQEAFDFMDRALQK